MLLWRFPEPVRMIASGTLGGGFTRGEWVINAEVTLSYRRDDPTDHLRGIATELGLPPDAGAGLMTAADVRRMRGADDGGAHCDATVGLSYPTWAAEAGDAPPPATTWRPGTINLVCLLPVPLTDAALVNAVITATEAKTQALLEAGVPGTGTASDAIVVCCPDTPAGAVHPQLAEYCGPRSLWGARLARAVHAAVAEGTAGWAELPA